MLAIIFCGILTVIVWLMNGGVVQLTMISVTFV